jgi:hypothetical protein
MATAPATAYTPVPHDGGLWYRAYDRREPTKYYRLTTVDGVDMWTPENGRGKSYRCDSINGRMGATNWGFSDIKVEKGVWQPMNPYDG